jgi:hypothetical protein
MLLMLPMLDEEDEPEPALGDVADEPELLARSADEEELELLLLSRLACAKTGATRADTVKTLIRVIFRWMEFFIATSALPHSCQAPATSPSR